MGHEVQLRLTVPTQSVPGALGREAPAAGARSQPERRYWRRL